MDSDASVRHLSSSRELIVLKKLEVKCGEKEPAEKQNSAPPTLLIKYLASSGHACGKRYVQDIKLIDRLTR